MVKKKFVSNLLTKSDNLYCPRCFKLEVYHNDKFVICINCENKLREKFDGKELDKKIKKLRNILKRAEKLKFECYSV